MTLRNGALAAAVVILSASCQPDSISLVLRSSDVHKVDAGGIVFLPIEVVVSIYKPDADRDYIEIQNLLAPFLPTDPAFSEGVENEKSIFRLSTSIPFGTRESLARYSIASKPLLRLVREKNAIIFHVTESWREVQRELKRINWLLNVELPAKSTFVEFRGDTENPLEFRAYSVFVEGKAQMLLQQTVFDETSRQFEFRGGEASIWHTLPLNLFIIPQDSELSRSFDEAAPQSNSK